MRPNTEHEHYLSCQLDYTTAQLQDTLRPNILLSEMSQLILQMLIEYTEYVQRNKETDRNKASKARLIRLLSISTELNGLGDQGAYLRLKNRNMYNSIEAMYKRIKILEAEVEKYKKSFDEL